jgi:hypothetical protein
VALATGPGDRLPGLAAVAALPGRAAGPASAPVGVRPFGRGGPALAARLLAALERWAGAGRPEAANWRFAVVPRKPGGAEPAVPAGAFLVAKQHTYLVATLP